jgi:5-oxoprolinase (ATP-hydrolysing)
MSESIKTVIARNPAMQPGDVYVLNDPYHGGTHLPDVTVVTPVYLDGEGHARPSFYVASRGHHADIGGSTPGSMPPFSTRPSTRKACCSTTSCWCATAGCARPSAAQLAVGPYPARNPHQTMADLRAQIAANEKGVQELRAMVAQFGRDTVAAYMQHVQDNAEESVRRVITALKDGAFDAAAGQRRADRVQGHGRRRRARGHHRLHRHQRAAAQQLQRPKAVTMAAVLYVFRTLVDDDIPLNAGCLKPLQVIVPEGCMLNPRPPAAVVAGNVETSQCVTNALYGALGVMAASQCTMNNFTFGNDAPVLRDHLRRLRRRARASTAPASCRPT